MIRFLAVVYVSLIMIGISISQTCDYISFSSPVWINDELIAVSGCTGVQIYTENLEKVGFIELHDVDSVNPSLDSQWLVANATEQIYLIDLDSFEVVLSLDGYFEAWNPESNAFIFSNNLDTSSSILSVFNTNSLRTINEINVNYIVSRVTWISSNEILFIGIGDFDVYNWNIQTLPEIIYEQSSSIEWSVFTYSGNKIWSPNGSQFVFVSRPNWSNSDSFEPPFLGIENIKTGTMRKISDGNYHVSTDMDVSWHPSGEFFVVSNAYAINLFSVVNYEHIARLPNNGHDALIYLEINDCSNRDVSNLDYWIDWHPDGKRLLVSSYCGIEIIQVFE